MCSLSLSLCSAEEQRRTGSVFKDWSVHIPTRCQHQEEVNWVFMDTEAFGSNCVPHLLDGFHCLRRIMKMTPSVKVHQTFLVPPQLPRLSVYLSHDIGLLAFLKWLQLTVLPKYVIQNNLFQAWTHRTRIFYNYPIQQELGWALPSDRVPPVSTTLRQEQKPLPCIAFGKTLFMSVLLTHWFYPGVTFSELRWIP